MLHDLRLGMVNDYPFWSEHFVKLDLKEEHRVMWYDRDEGLDDTLPETLIACKNLNLNN